MPTIAISRPNPKQELFFLSRKRFIGYGGARGGGKSWGLRTKLVLLAFSYTNLKLLLLRKTLPELRENHLLPLMQLLYGIAKYNKDERAFTFPNGSRLKLGYCDHENDIYQYQGQEYDVIGIEECTHFTWAQVQYLMTCNRNTRTDFKPRMYFTGNPGGVGHNWFKRLFVKPKYNDNENPDDYEYIPATVDDNYAIMENNPEYIQILDNLPEKLKQAHRYGNWDIFEGQFWEDFIDRIEPYGEGENKVLNPRKERRWTHVIEPFEIPKEWPIYRSFDFGYAKPFSMAWWTIDYDGRIYRILEMYGCTKEPNEGVKWTPDKMFKEAAKVESEHRWLKGKQIYGVADPSIWDASRGESVNDVAVRYGIYFGKGDNERIPGWMQMHYRLEFDDEGYPMMYIFSTCKAFIRTIPLLQYSDTKPEDLDTDGEDHVADETRYFCMSRPIRPVIRKKQSEAQQFDPLNMFNDDKKYDRYDWYSK
jgi:phage terminase large subunit